MSKAKVLIVCPSYPYPEHKDGISKIISNLLIDKDYYDADVLFLDSGSDSFNKQNATESKFYSLKTKPVNKLSTGLKWLISGYPYNVEKFSPFFKAIADSIISIESRYDVIHISTPSIIPSIDFFPETLLKRTILFPIDSITLYTERRVRQETSWSNKIALFYDLIKCKSFEKKYYAKAGKAVFVSPKDSERVLKLNSKTAAFHIANGVDTKFFAPDNTVEKIPGSIIFTGNMDYAPNKDAALFLIKDIAPLIKKIFPDYRIFIVGSNPGNEIKRLETENIVITGFVEDIRDYLNKAMIYVSPLRFGSGIKNKVLEAMSMNMTVIGSEISFEGINVKHQFDCIKTPFLTAASLSDEIINSLHDFNKLKRLGNNARQRIVSSYSWDAIRRDYGALYGSYTQNERII